MLIELHIRNFALIDEVILAPGVGFTVLTGETGAGKSIVVDALEAVLGDRIGSDVVRTGASRAVVEAVFDVSNCPAAATRAVDYGLEPEDGQLILSREIAREGKSQCRVNGRLVTSAILRELTGLLIDIHGQHEHQSLLSVPLHADILDSWCGEEATLRRSEIRLLHGELSELVSERERLQTDERERARLLDLYGFQIQEILAADLRPGEEEELARERSRLANAEKLQEAASEVYTALGSENGGAIDTLSAATLAMERMARMDASLSECVEMLNNALFSAQEALALIRNYREGVNTDPLRLEQIDNRLDLIRLMKKKYGDTVEQIEAYAQELETRISDLSNAEERSAALDGQIDQLRGELERACSELTRTRKTSAPKFEQAVVKELADLAMEQCKFEVMIKPTEPGPRGADEIEFLISPNPGEPVKPLVKIASGGELSRIMLALKTVSSKPQVPTLVFDEIDSGIGGRTAQVVGDKLASLSDKCQVLCVTHLPQIASKATSHWVVRKSTDADRTVVDLSIVEGEARIAELARMLSGSETSTAAEHAREMLSVANQGTSQA